MVKCTGKRLVVKRLGVLSKVQMLNLVLGVGVFSPLPILGLAGSTFAKICGSLICGSLQTCSRAGKGGGVQTGGFPDLDLSFFLRFFCPCLALFALFPGFSRSVLDFPRFFLGDFSRLLLFLCLGLLEAPTRDVP